MTKASITNRIAELFEEKHSSILSVYYTAGFPQLTDTVSIAQYLEKAGADLIEIGIPFSDPVADGPTIQQSNDVALKNGMNLHLLIDQVKELRKTVNLPVILMGYVNPVLQYGVEKFCKDASAAGVDGLILPDLPLDEYIQEYQELVSSYGLTNSFLISPTTSEERIRKIDEVSNSFIYAVSASSTTGAKGQFEEEQLAYFKRLKDMKLKNPFLIGFGISNQQTFSVAVSYGAGAIVGSAFVNVLKNSSALESDIKQFVSSLKATS